MENTNNKQTSSVSYETFCEHLEQLLLRNTVVTERIEAIINSIQIDKRVELLLIVISSQKAYQVRRIALTKLHEIFVSWRLENVNSKTKLNEIYSHMINLIIDKSHEDLLEKILLSTCCLIEVINKEIFNKWKVVADLVMRCSMRSSQENINQILFTLITQHFEIFGHKKRQILIQYRKFLIECFEQSQRLPHLALMASNVVLSLLRNKKYNFHKVTIPRVIPKIMDALEEMVHTDDGFKFVSNLVDILDEDESVFKEKKKKVISIVCRILKYKTIDKDIFLSVIQFVTTFIKKFPTDIEEKYLIYTIDIIKNTIKYIASLHLDPPTEWFEGCLKYGDLNTSVHSAKARYNVRIIINSIGSDVLYHPLMQLVTHLLDSPNWKKVVTGIDLLNVVIHQYGASNISNPLNPFIKLKRFFSTDNPAIAYNTIKTAEGLCSVFKNLVYSNIYHEYVSLIARLTQYHKIFYIKLEAINAVGNISRIMSSHGENREAKIMVKMLTDVFHVFHQKSDIIFLKSITKIVTSNLGEIYKLLDARIDPYTPVIIENLLKMIDKLYWLSECSSSLHCVLKCIKKTIKCCPTNCPEEFAIIIVKYVNDFSSANNLPKDNIAIPPCFFSFLLQLSKYKAQCFYPIVPTLAYSVIKFLNEFKNIQLGLHKQFGSKFNEISPPYICSKCYRSNIGATFEEFWKMTLWFFAEYSETLFENFEIYLTFFHKIFENEGNTRYNEELGLVLHNLLLCAFTSGDVNWTMEFWNQQLKLTFFRFMNDLTTKNLHIIIRDFTKCATITMDDNILKLSDIESLGNNFNYWIVHIIQMTDINYEPINMEYNRLNFPLEIDDKFSKESIMQVTLECVQNLLPIYKEKIVNACFPMIETLVTYKGTKTSENYCVFTVSVLEDILKFVYHPDVDFKRLFPLVMDFCGEVLSKWPSDKAMKRTVNVMNTLKKNYTSLFRNHFSTFEAITRERLEYFLL